MWKTLEYISNKTGEKRIFENYEISDTGLIRHKKNKNLRTQYQNKEGSWFLTIKNKGVTYKLFVTRAVLSTYKEKEYFAKATTKHINGDNSDNSIDNLKWITIEECANNEARLKKLKETKEKNDSYAKAVETKRKNGVYEAMVQKRKASDNYKDLIISNKKRGKKVIGRNTEGEIIYELENSAEGRKFGFDPCCIRKCCHGKQKTHKNLLWTFI